MLREKLLGLEKNIGDKMEGLNKTNDSLLSKINSLEKDNTQNFTDFRKDMENKLTEHDKHWQVKHDPTRSVTLVLNQQLKAIKTLNVITEKRIGEMEAENQKLLKSLSDFRQDFDNKSNDHVSNFDGKLQQLINYRYPTRVNLPPD